VKNVDRSTERGASAPRASSGEEKTVAQEVEALRGMDVPALIEKYREVWGKEPHVKRKEFLWKRIAWKLQEQRLGGLSGAASKRLEELIGEIRLPGIEDRRTVRGNLRKAPRADQPGVGTVITRTWHGRTVTLKAVEGGFELDGGTVYKSLSAAANGLTGSKWNGPLFWGLTPRRKA
jgi:hypothetical protein